MEGSNSQGPLFEIFVFRAEEILKSKTARVLTIDLSKQNIIIFLLINTPSNQADSQLQK